MKKKLFFILMLCISIATIQAQEAISNTVKVAIGFNEFVKKYVVEKVNEWQQPGYFDKYETESEYYARVNPETQEKEIEKKTKEAEELYRDMYAKTIDLKKLILGEYNRSDGSFPIYHPNLYYYNMAVVAGNSENARIIGDNFNSLSKSITKIDFSTEPPTVTFQFKDNNSGKTFDSHLSNSSNVVIKQMTPITASDVNRIDYEEYGKNIELLSEVTKNIPKYNGKKKENCYVLIIGNKNYKNGMSNIPYAHQDAEAFKQYCITTFGIPDDITHLKYIFDATSQQIRDGIKWLFGNANENNANLILYYSGHGVYDCDKQKPKFLATDVSLYSEGNYNIEDLFIQMESYRNAKLTIFFDACLNGHNDNDRNLLTCKGLNFTIPVPKENVVLFTATSPNQSSYQHNDNLSCFTYFLLKYFKENKGITSYSDMWDFVEKEVKKYSNAVDRTNLQNPQIYPAENLGDRWKNWSF